MTGQLREPIIVFGMHRSGTSMVATMLAQLGAFMGDDLEVNQESMFFLNCNDWMLHQSRAAWDNPGAIRWLLASEDLMGLVEDYLRYRLGNLPVRRYLGWVRYLRGERPLRGMNQPWGWKDPRNTFTLPIWLRMFPAAKLVHVYRSGVAVAASLHRRGGMGLARARQRHLRRRNLGMYRWLAKRHGFIYSVRCVDLDGAYSLWEEYVERAWWLTENCGLPVLQVKFEDFVGDATAGLTELATFCGVDATPDSIVAVAAGADRARAESFRDDSRLLDLYERVRTRPWMQRLGY